MRRLILLGYLGLNKADEAKKAEILEYKSDQNIEKTLSLTSIFNRQKRSVQNSLSDWEKHQEEFDYYRTFGYQCYSKAQQTYYKPGDTWFIERPFMEEITNGTMTTYYKCSCIGGSSGQYSCIPDEVPCYSNALQQAFNINEQWDWRKPVKFRNGAEVMDTYLCTCEGGTTGKYKCREKVEGCIDSKYNLKKYKIHEIFNQTRDDGLTYECSCNKGQNEEDRVIRCSLRNYCMYQNEAHEIGDTWTTYNEQTNEPHMSCSCHRNPQNRNSNIVRCRYLPSSEDRRAEQQRKQQAEQSRRQYQQRLDREKQRREEKLRRDEAERMRRIQDQRRRAQEQEIRRREFQERVRQAEAKRLDLQKRREEAAKARVAAAAERRRQFQIRLQEREEQRKIERERMLEEQRMKAEERRKKIERDEIRKAEAAAEQERMRQEEAAMDAREYLKDLETFDDSLLSDDAKNDEYYLDGDENYDEEIYDDYTNEK